MDAIVSLTLLLALSAASAGSDEEERRITVNKCCREFELLSNDGQSCVKVDWPRNVFFNFTDSDSIVPPLDERWLQRWLPPGLPVRKVKKVRIRQPSRPALHGIVDASSVWDERYSLNKHVWRKQVVFDEDNEETYIVRPKPGGGRRTASYCVDASSPPMESFAMLYRMHCSGEECVTKCCRHGELMVNKNGGWVCEVDDEALCMYFLLIAAWFWLTALCVNMSLGFRLQAAPRKRSVRKRFMVFSAIAWGVPAALTITCFFLFIPPDDFLSASDNPWYPSLFETRMCYNEPLIDSVGKGSNKYGTALFYYGPVECLAICNLFGLVITLRKVRRLRRGNSVLRKEEDLRHRTPGGTTHPSTSDIAGDNGRQHGNGGANRSSVDAKRIKMYLKMILMTGAIEVFAELIVWVFTKFSNEEFFWRYDYHYPYRSSGYVTDFFRAACVFWLAAPEGGYLGPFLRRLRGDKK